MGYGSAGKFLPAQKVAAPAAWPATVGLWFCLSGHFRLASLVSGIEVIASSPEYCRKLPEEEDLWHSFTIGVNSYAIPQCG